MKNSTILFILFCFFVSSVFAQLTVKDQEPTPNILMQVHDEGTAGSIWLGPISEYLDDSKLYNNGGNLFWGTDQLGLAGNAGGWTDNGTIICNTTLTDKVGIGINPPTANLHVSGDDGVLFTGTYDVGIIPIEGAGTRMMWYPKKAAFRVGYVNDTKWDDANIGSISTAIGTNTTASGNISTAMGQRTTASGNTSTAMGYNTTASGFTSTTMGESTTASGEGSTAMGYYTTANSRSSLVIGKFNIGNGSPTSWIDTDPLFEIGNGTSSSDKSNAVTVLKNGKVGIGIENPSEKLIIKMGGLSWANSHFALEASGSTNKWDFTVGTSDIFYIGYNESSKMVINTDGDVGIGTTSPSRKFYVNGDAGGAGDWHNDSDRRLKKNIKTIPNALEKVNNLHGVNFEWNDTKNHSSGVKMGFIAQESKEIIPEVVSKSGEYYSMQYASITALLVEAVKEQQKMIEDQQIIIAEIRKEIEQLKRR